MALTNNFINKNCTLIHQWFATSGIGSSASCGVKTHRGRSVARAGGRVRDPGDHKVNGTRLSHSHTGIPYLNLVRRKMAVDSIPRLRCVYGELIKHTFLHTFFPSIVNSIVAVAVIFLLEIP